jgi:hypothetical protein
MKNLNKLSPILILTILIIGLSTSKIHAQEDEISTDSPMIVPSQTNSPSAPPTIIDESDANGVSEVDEYDN